MLFSVNYDGVLYEIEDSEEIFDRISTDPAFATNYFESRLFGDTENCAAIANEIQIAGVDCAVPKNTEKESSWDHKSSLLFLEECLKRKSDLRNLKIRRRTVFLEIQKEMISKGSNFSDRALDKKLQNMKTHYNYILDNNNKKSTGRGRISWPYFELMCQIYTDEVRVRDCPTFDSSQPLNISNTSVPSGNSLGGCATQTESYSSMKRPSPSQNSPSSKRTQTNSAPRVRASKSEIARQEVIDLEKKKIALGQAHLEAILKLVALKEKEMELMEKKINLEMELKDLKKKEIEAAERKLPNN